MVMDLSPGDRSANVMKIVIFYQLEISTKMIEPVCCKKQQKKRPNQETGLENRGTLEALNDTILILND